MEMTGRHTVPVAGEIPNPIDPPSGCAFHPRCPQVSAQCRKVIPELTTLVNGVQVACPIVIGEQNRNSEPERAGIDY